ncbi:MAG: hypothetical protein P8013_02690 [Candidatus Sulfobium sp.]|jgi:hypothetical protein
MNNSMYTRKNEMRKERRQQKVDAGLVKERFPEVAAIVVNMTYNQRGLQKSLPRVVNFFPDSSALFIIDCLNKDCVDGGFDLTQIITATIIDRRKSVKGDLCCEGEGPSAGHSTIAYEVSIRYV